jgi:alpha-beta hydrolase superfamily lysophospholipase
MRGHGKTADLSVNDAGRGGLLGHAADNNSFFWVVEDLRIITRYITEKTMLEYGPEFGKLPFFILGHSWGSFLVQAYIQNFSADSAAEPAPALPLCGCILSGTRGPGGAKIKAGALFLSLIAAIKGSRRYSSLAFALTTGPYNKFFRPNRTPYDWLSREEKAVDAYAADPFCGKRCSSGFYRDMIKGLSAIHRKDSAAKIDRNLPVYIFCGSADPVGDMGRSPTALVNAYRAAGINDLEFVIYPEARHETLNETNREEVTEALLGWLQKHVT